MSGILKRKLEEGPSPYLSLQGSDDDEVSCSDSGNSSDSLNHPVPSGLLDCKISSILFLAPPYEVFHKDLVWVHFYADDTQLFAFAA